MSERSAELSERLRQQVPLPADASIEEISMLLSESRARAHELIEESVTAAREALTRRAADQDGTRQDGRLSMERVRRSVDELTAEVRALGERLDRIEGLLRSDGTLETADTSVEAVAGTAAEAPLADEGEASTSSTSMVTPAATAAEVADTANERRSGVAEPSVAQLAGLADEEAESTARAEAARAEAQAEAARERAAAEAAEAERIAAEAAARAEREDAEARALAEREAIEATARAEREAAEAAAEAERVAAEARAQAEQARLEAEAAEAAARAEQEREAAVRAEQEREAAVRAEQEREAAARAEQEREAAARAEQEREAAARAEQEREAAARAEQEREAAARAEQEREAAARAEQEREAAARAEQAASEMIERAPLASRWSETRSPEAADAQVTRDERLRRVELPRSVFPPSMAPRQGGSEQQADDEMERPAASMPAPMTERPGLWVPPSTTGATEERGRPEAVPEPRQTTSLFGRESRDTRESGPVSMPSGPSRPSGVPEPRSTAAVATPVAEQVEARVEDPSELTFSPDGGPVVLRIAPISGFQGLMRVQDAVVQLPAVREATVEAYARGEARLRIHLTSSLQAETLADSLSQSLVQRARVLEASRDDRGIQIALG